MDTTAPTRLRSIPSWMINQVAARGDRLVNERLGTVDARRHHYRLLAALEEFGPASQAKLSHHSYIYRSDLVAVLNELADRQFIERAPDPADARRNVITLTAAGLA